jgi:hypothetical protein
MIDLDRLKLLFGPYQVPPLKRGDRADCLYRDATVVVSGWTDARIPWPRCYLADGRARAHGLLVDEELARAVRHESAAAVAYWWGVSRSTVQHWRNALGVGRLDAEGSRRLIHRAAQIASSARDLPASTALRRNMPWTPEEIELLGVLPDEEVAARTRRTVHAVRWKRRGLGKAHPLRRGRVDAESSSHIH